MCLICSSSHGISAGLYSTGIRAGSSQIPGDVDLGVEERVSEPLTLRAHNATKRACPLQISIILSRWTREVRLLRPDRVHSTYCAYQGTLGPDRRQDHMRRRSGCGQEICGTDHRQRCCPWGCPHERVSVSFPESGDCTHPVHWTSGRSLDQFSLSYL